MVGIDILDELPDDIYKVTELDNDRLGVYLSTPYIEKFETPNVICYRYCTIFNGYLIDIIPGGKTPKFVVERFTDINKIPNHFIKENKYWKRNGEDIQSDQYTWVSKTLHFFWDSIMGGLNIDDINAIVQIKQQEPKNIIETPYGWHSVRYDSVLDYSYSGLIYLEFNVDDIFYLQRKAISLYDKGVSTKILDIWIMDLNSKLDSTGIVNKTIRKLNGIFNK